jgi:hypothetical protein
MIARMSRIAPSSSPVAAATRFPAGRPQRCCAHFPGSARRKQPVQYVPREIAVQFHDPQAPRRDDSLRASQRAVLSGPDAVGARQCTLAARLPAVSPAWEAGRPQVPAVLAGRASAPVQKSSGGQHDPSAVAVEDGRTGGVILDFDLARDRGHLQHETSLTMLLTGPRRPRRRDRGRGRLGRRAGHGRTPSP